ncbi:hypothetical protein cypCar_00026461 [Cyprinus carpio]|nr:hypothetical protein cypCar_00026461 [Cyprinus carpio]
MSDNLCNNLGCGNAIQHWSVKTDTKKCWHFSCTGLETSVWQCGSKKDNCENILSVACKNSVKFSSTEKCGVSHYRNKNGKDMNTDMNEMDKMDAENRGEEDEDDRKRDSSGTEYDDIEGQANGISPSQTHHDDNVNLPLLPKRPENILDQDTYEVEKEKEEDYDDVIPIEPAANENAGTTGTQAHVDVDVDEGADSEAGPGAEAVLVTTEVEVHTQ